MSKKIYVYSTLAAPVDYHVYAHRGDGIPAHKERTIHIKGGAGIANKNLITPLGVVTEITEEEAALLEEHSLFKLHKQNGYVQISRANVDIEKAVADMDRNDESRPLTPADYADGGEGVKAVSNAEATGQLPTPKAPGRGGHKVRG